MARKKKAINRTPYPQYVIETVARCLWPDIVAYFESEEGKKEYAAWITLQEREREMAQEASSPEELAA